MLQNYKRLWEQDKVLGIYVANVVGPPLDYVAQKNVAHDAARWSARGLLVEVPVGDPHRLDHPGVERSD